MKMKMKMKTDVFVFLLCVVLLFVQLPCAYSYALRNALLRRFHTSKRIIQSSKNNESSVSVLENKLITLGICEWVLENKDLSNSKMIFVSPFICSDTTLMSLFSIR